MIGGGQEIAVGMMRSFVIAIFVLAIHRVWALTATEWRTQSIYQVLTDRFAQTSSSTAACSNLNDYCGGSWQGLLAKLDYIQAMGFTAVWISPIVKNVEGYTADGSGYHGYWAKDIFSVNPHFGSPADLMALSNALHKKGMYLMVDIVVNHMGYIGSVNSIDYSVFNPFGSQSYFHPYCPIDYNNQTSAEICWMGDNTVPLPDIKTEDTTVRSIYQNWIKDLVANYSIDSIRLDTCSEVEQSFFPGFVDASGVYVVGEVFNGNPTYTCPYQNYLPGVLNYPAYFWVTQAFQNTGGSISNLVNGISAMKQDCADTTLLGSFLENHDNPRFPSLTSDVSLIKNAIAFTMLADGIPIIYYGQEQEFAGGSVPNNREAFWTSGYSTSSPLYSHISTLNKLRRQAISRSSTYATYQASTVYNDTSTIVMRKGNTGYQIVGVFSNKGSSGASYSLTLASSATGFSPSQNVIEVLGCTKTTTDSKGNLLVSMASGLPRIFYSEAQLSGSGLCSNPSSSTSSSTTSSVPTGCATAVAVAFMETVSTNYGETVKVVGNVAQLGSWDPSKAVPLGAAAYTSSNPVWSGTISGFVPGSSVQYKYIKVEADGSVTWEADPNHTYVVPSCAASGAVSNTWQT